MDTPTIALIVSLLSLYVSVRVAWHNLFRPAQIVGAFPHLTIWSFSSYLGDRPTGEIDRHFLLPAFWLANIGAREALVEDMRVRMKVGESEVLFFPTSVVPLEAVESPNLFKDSNDIGHGGPFTGVCLSKSAVYKCAVAFTAKRQDYEKLRGVFRVEVQIRLGGKCCWQTVLSEEFDFQSHPVHLQSLNFGNGVTGGSRISQTLSKKWLTRRGE